MKVLALDFVRQAIEQTLELEHLKNPNYFGGKNQVNLMSFYEQLLEDYEVNRYKEVYNDLVKQQNRSDLIMNGTIVAPETPQIMNVNSSLIVPLAFNCSFRVALKDRDSAIETIDNLMKIMRGRKRDIACFESGKLFMVGTIANNVLGNPICGDGDFIGTIGSFTDQTIDTLVKAQLNAIKSYVGNDLQLLGTYYYFENNGKMYKADNNVGQLAVFKTNNIDTTLHATQDSQDQDTWHCYISVRLSSSPFSGNVGKGIIEYSLKKLGIGGSSYLSNATNIELAYDDVDLELSFDLTDVQEDMSGATITDFELDVQFAKTEDASKDWYVDESFEYHAQAFDKYKVSLSFDSMKIDEPKTLDATEYCTIMFSGSASLTDKDSALGNDLTKVSIAKDSLVVKTGTITLDKVKHWLEPLEMPSGLGISGELSQLASHNFVQNKHNDGINPTFDYSFVLNKSESLLNQLWKYARYGIQGTPSNSYSDGVTPNTRYEITELWNSWCVIDKFVFLAKATDSVDNENTESDVLTIKVKFELQKE